MQPERGRSVAGRGRGRGHGGEAAVGRLRSEVISIGRAPFAISSGQWRARQDALSSRVGEEGKDTKD